MLLLSFTALLSPPFPECLADSAPDPNSYIERKTHIERKGGLNDDEEEHVIIGATQETIFNDYKVADALFFFTLHRLLMF